MRLLSLLFACWLIGCATTRITSEDPQAEIFLDDHFIGVGETEVERIGPPHRAQLEARKGSHVIGQEPMARSFTFKTLLWGMCSYYTGWYWGWYYPENVRIATTRTDISTAEASRKAESPWSNPHQSIWMQPLK
jgi:hypothetical protein